MLASMLNHSLDQWPSAFVNGAWATSSTGFTRENPADFRLVGRRYGSATESQLREALDAARNSQRDWSRQPPGHRQALLVKMAAGIRANASALARILTDENGKTLKEALAEVSGAAATLEYFGSWALWGQHGQLKRSAQSPAKLVLIEKAARGVAVIITPWNFPAFNPSLKIAAALVSGNSVIWRPSPLTAGVALALTAVFQEAGLPAGVLNTIVEDGSVLSRKLVESEDLGAISFTGSTAVGRSIAAAASQRGVAVQCEMGGKNAIVIMPDADIGTAAAAVANGAFLFAGQKCTAASRVFVHHEIETAFVDALVQAAAAMKVGSPLDDATTIGPVVTRAQLARLNSAVKDAAERGGRIAYGNQPLDAALSCGSYMLPTILAGVSPGDLLMSEELFGPVLGIVSIRGVNHAIAEVNRGDYGLAASIFTNRMDHAFQFLDEAQCGLVKVNEATPGLEPHASFGGWKDSGFGIGELGEEGIDFFTHKKTSYLVYGQAKK